MGIFFKNSTSTALQSFSKRSKQHYSKILSLNYLRISILCQIKPCDTKKCLHVFTKYQQVVIIIDNLDPNYHYYHSLLHKNILTCRIHFIQHHNQCFEIVPRLRIYQFFFMRLIISHCYLIIIIIIESNEFSLTQQTKRQNPFYFSVKESISHKIHNSAATKHFINSQSVKYVSK